MNDLGTDDDFNIPKTSRAKKPPARSTKLGLEFDAVVLSKFPTSAGYLNRARMYANINLLLEQHWTEQELRRAFHIFGSRSGELVIKDACWEEFYRRRKTFLPEARAALIGFREGDEQYNGLGAYEQIMLKRRLAQGTPPAV